MLTDGKHNTICEVTSKGLKPLLSTHISHSTFEKDWQKMKLTELKSQKSEGQQAKHARLYSDIHQSKERQTFRLPSDAPFYMSAPERTGGSRSVWKDRIQIRQRKARTWWDTIEYDMVRGCIRDKIQHQTLSKKGPTFALTHFNGDQKSFR